MKLSRRDFLKRAGAGVLVLAGARAVGTAAGKTQAAGRPNFVFILADDLGWADVAFNGNTFYETPNIDRLAASGMRFTQAYAACAVCSPTRASIQTGKYPARLGITDYIPGEEHPEKPLLTFPTRTELPGAERTLAEALRDGGYRTAFIGKWHLGGRGFLPQDQGYQTNVAGGTYGAPPQGYFSPYGIEGLSEGPKGEYLTERLTKEALARLDDFGRTPAEPFILFLSHYTVHMPIQPPPALKQYYEAKQERAGVDAHWKRADYAGMVASLDASVGAVLERLDRLGLTDKTAVFFMSDNGGVDYARGVTSNWPLRAGKGRYYEGGIREPLVVRWPGVTQAGSHCDTPVVSTDFFPTMLEMAGLPPEPKHHVDGLSFAALLKDPAATLPREALYWHYPHYHGSGATPCGAVRAGDYKLIEFFEDNRVELYNVRADVSEEHDLAQTMPEKAAELRERLHRWRAEVGARMPVVNTNPHPRPVKGKAGRKGKNGKKGNNGRNGKMGKDGEA